MPRKLTGSALAIALIAIIAVKHVSLGFCLCKDEFFVSDCPCTCDTTAVESCSCDEEQEPVNAPCDDCTVPVSLDAGDFLWTADSFSPLDQATTPVALPSACFNDTVQPGCIIGREHSTRGSPPGWPPPHLLRTTVLRL